MKTYNRRINQLNTTTTMLLSQSGDRAKVHSIGEIPLTGDYPNVGDPALRDDDPTNVLDEAVLLFVNSDISDTDTIKVMYPDGTINTLIAWKLKATCTEVVKVFDSDTTVANANIFLSK